MSTYPDKILLVHDNSKLTNVGALEDGRFIFQEQQFDPADPKGRQFFVSYVFDRDGELVDDIVTAIGHEDKLSEGTALGAVTSHTEKFGPFKPANVVVKPFSLSREGLTFGLVARQLDEGSEDEDDDTAPWVVEALPGKTIIFHAPWDKGGYQG